MHNKIAIEMVRWSKYFDRIAPGRALVYFSEGYWGQQWKLCGVLDDAVE
jgi:hypothetical protein